MLKKLLLNRLTLDFLQKLGERGKGKVQGNVKRTLTPFPLTFNPHSTKTYARVLFTLAAVSICLATASMAAAETLRVDREWALNRLIKVEVTQMGIVVDFGSPISAVNLSHMGQIVFQGFDGILCKIPSQCPANSAPTMLLLRKIPPIDFKNQQPSVDGSALLFVNTRSGVYRIEFQPVSKKPKYTKVEIINEPLTPLFQSVVSDQ